MSQPCLSIRLHVFANALAMRLAQPSTCEQRSRLSPIVPRTRAHTGRTLSALKRFAATYLGPENFPFDPFGPAPRPKDDNLAPSTRDALFDWQIRGQDFQRLDADSLVQARICGKQHTHDRMAN